MPIKIADSLPAKDILENENIFVMASTAPCIRIFVR